MEIRTRIAPSPTGALHIGTARAALFNWLFTRKHGGKFILRIEDTDKERSLPSHESGIIEGLKWLGVDWDEGPDIGGDYRPYRQSERGEIYKNYIKKLFDKDLAYYCVCMKEELEVYRQAQLSRGLIPKYSEKCRLLKNTEGVIRFKTSHNLQIHFNDIIRGNLDFSTEILGDMVIAKSIEEPLFILAGVIDDALMKISHVIRGEDHLPNTPKQILLQEAFNFQKPIYAHLPLVLSLDRKKMSKRLGETSIFEYRKQGYLSEAILNFIALLGWHPSSDKEIFTKSELIKEFDIKRVQKAGAIFDIKKLDWLNSEYIKKLDPEKLVKMLIEFIPQNWTKNKNVLKKAVILEQTRVKKLADFSSSLRFFFETPDYDRSLLLQGNNIPLNILSNLKKIKDLLIREKDEEFTREEAMTILGKIVRPENRGEVLWPLRVALSGLRVSPGPHEIISVLGKSKTLERIEIAIKKLA